MGEEDKKPEDTKPEEPPRAAPDQEQTGAESDNKESKDAVEEKPLPKPPQDIVLSVFMHCEGCARKVRRCLRGFEGVESVETDCRTHKVVVKGEKADPVKVLGRLQRKSHRRVELISPIPEPTAPIPEPVEKPKTEDTKPQPQILTTVVLKVHMHCEACAQEIKRRIHRMKGVELVDPDLKSSQVTVKGAIDPAALVAYVHRRTGKHAAIVKQEPEITPENNESEVAAKEVEEEKKADASDGVESEKKVEEESKVEEKPAAAAAGGGEAEGTAPAEADPVAEEAPKMVEVKKNEYHYYPQRYIMEMYPYAPPMMGDVAYPAPHMVVDAYPAPMMMGHAYPPQMFSDENPNACSVM
ncbi:heavy metal-associated isoprenylated plant protein 7 [Benincasa hispida]|uniref:heavy metal-associated isoprenylated plant protein 7 n=1 Tax=Benincasa hispida TaxID=102211 RepID=UPI0018FFF78E|nr:heavy metal-associated isoprenylated plant protein 7 [Benincasa hispida]